MGQKRLELNMPPDYTEDEIRQVISRKLQISNFSFQYELKSLDARQKRNIHWQMRLLIVSDEIKDELDFPLEELVVPFRKRNTRVGVVGSGPAGFFAAHILCKAGFDVTIFERGMKVEDRARAIHDFESGKDFIENGNYVYGEGGAGTFSDGKLTSRTKGISILKRYVLHQYVQAGAPEEIVFLSKPHIGSNNLRNVVMNLRLHFLNAGGKIEFENHVSKIVPAGKRWKIESSSGISEMDVVVWASGHSAYDSFRMLMSIGVPFIPKPFALGVRTEHPQELINRSMWNATALDGLKAAEYVLRWQGQNNEAAYSFCMCPGGKVVQASPLKGMSIVNGMSSYHRNSPFANSAIVAPVHPESVCKKNLSAEAMLDYVENIERKVWNVSGNFSVPANTVSAFLRNAVSSQLPETSYSHGIFSYDFAEIFDSSTIKALRNGMSHFEKSIPGFHTGIILGLESKTSSSVQVVRSEDNGPCLGFDNLYVVGEGSGFAGGIISSAVDGIKSALHIIKSR